MYCSKTIFRYIILQLAPSVKVRLMILGNQKFAAFYTIITFSL
uniref:Uncharacterized protein n=1 Tax=Heterorhabditis bacteriophora TaxID=37862 RepID=A0A1I7WCC9_HETBA